MIAIEMSEGKIYTHENVNVHSQANERTNQGTQQNETNSSKIISPTEFRFMYLVLVQTLRISDSRGNARFTTSMTFSSRTYYYLLTKRVYERNEHKKTDAFVIDFIDHK